MKRALILVWCLGCMVWGCTAFAAPLQVAVSIIPQLYIVDKIGKDFVNVTVLLPPGASPVTYEPRPAQMTILSKSRLFFAQGVPFESAWLPRFQAANPNCTVVNVGEGIQKRPMAAHHHHHEDGEEGHHENDEHAQEDHQEGSANGVVLDPHIWLSPELMKTQAATITKALQQADSEHKDDYAANLAAFEDEITDLQTQIHAILPDHGAFMVFHPSWGYFAHEFGLEQIPIEDEGKEPSPKELAKLIHLGQEEHVSVIFVQPQFSKKSAQLIANQIPANVAVIDPLAPNWAQNMMNVAQQIAQAVK